ncbi:hypothetical protein CEXT_396591, partial [Caerostris extrusa]
VYIVVLATVIVSKDVLVAIPKTALSPLLLKEYIAPFTHFTKARVGSVSHVLFVDRFRQRESRFVSHEGAIRYFRVLCVEIEMVNAIFF